MRIVSNLLSITSVVVGGSAVFAAQMAMALPRPGEVLPDPEFSPEALSFVEDFSQNYNFNGILKLSNCSGSIVRFENSQASDKAIALTNGHCVDALRVKGFIEPNAYLANTPAVRSFRFLNQDGSISRSAVKSTKVIYATMTGTDLALYELAATYKEIADTYKVSALTMDSVHPKANENIEILSGYWQTGYSCHIDQFVYNLKVDAYTFADSIRYSADGCHIIHGTSGSPILNAETHKIIGINNTGNDDGEKCTMNNPCEVSTDGQIYFKQGLSYGQQTYVIYTCLNDDRMIDLNKAGCKLFH